MGSITTIVNQPVLIDFPSDFTDNGWVIEDGIAIHSGCNSGYIINSGMPIEVGKSYLVQYTVFDRSSGGVRAIIGNTLGNYVIQDGDKIEYITATNNGVFKFYSDGNLKIKRLYISEELEDYRNGRTLAFNEDANRFMTWMSFLPEFMVKFIDGFYSFQAGVMWEHNVNPIRNNFYDVQYVSKIIYYVNISPDDIKNFYTMRIDGNKPWSIPDVEIFPVEGKSEGMRSKLGKKNFENYQGQWFADFLRNMVDPRFDDELVALFRGAELQGAVMKVTMENDDVTEVRLVSASVNVSPQNFT